MGSRRFEDKPATREQTPLMVGLVGPSGSGKTYSMLRLLSGFQRISGGEVFVIDTEARRALHYADRFKFRHVPFGKPFSPADYQEAVEYCLRKGARNIGIDSMSHEHEGAGGVLEMHEVENRRLADLYETTLDAMKMSAWQKPKQQRTRFRDTMIQAPCNFVLCYRAKEKLKIKAGEKPKPLGFMPIAGEEYVFEATLNCLMLPGSNGVPTWHSDELGEHMIIKLPEQFRGYFLGEKQPRQLSEEVGEYLARWAAGTAAPPKVAAAELLASYEACSEPATYRALEEQRRANWASFKKDDKTRLKDAADLAAKRMAEPADGEGASASEAAGGEPIAESDEARDPGQEG